MNAQQFDVIVVGGGLAGSTLARSLAERGIKVVVLERETAFKDRVRGEQMQPWGVAEAAELGVLERLKQSCGHDQPWIDMYLGSMQITHRNLVETTAQRAGHFNFYHPKMQETLLQAAREAGAEVRRPVTVMKLVGGATPTVTVQEGASITDLQARLVVCADGRNSMGRSSAGFEVKRDAPFLVIAGVLLDQMPVPEDTGLIFLNPVVSQGSYLFPQGGGRVRAYVAYNADSAERIQGDRGMPRFVEISKAAGAPAELFDGVQVSGPLASFEAADSWVEHPFNDGIALVGDAAASNDPSWGQGLSITLRDVRVLRDRLLGGTDWDRAGHDYASEHDRHYGVSHEVTMAFKEMFMRGGPDADARRARALPLIGQDPMRVPDHLFSGPDLPWNAQLRATFFAEA